MIFSILTIKSSKFLSVVKIKIRVRRNNTPGRVIIKIFNGEIPVQGNSKNGMTLLYYLHVFFWTYLLFSSATVIRNVSIHCVGYPIRRSAKVSITIG